MVCGRQVYRDSPESVADEVLTKLAEGTRFYVLFPAKSPTTAETDQADEKQIQRRRSSAVARQSVTAHIMSLMQRGFTRLLVDGQTVDLQSPDDYPRQDFEGVYVLVDSGNSARSDIRQRLVDSLETCFQEGQGTAVIQTVEAEPQRFRFKTFNARTTRLSTLILSLGYLV